MTFRPVGKPGEPYPAWFRALTGKSGVYRIKLDGREVYVGSSQRNLRKTIARHFQTWARRKSFWAGLFGGGDRHDPGLTYDRARCTVAVELSTSKAARRREKATIARTRPRDNLADVPF